jgi:hypothetical protein
MIIGNSNPDVLIVDGNGSKYKVTREPIQWNNLQITKNLCIPRFNTKVNSPVCSLNYKAFPRNLDTHHISQGKLGRSSPL